MGMAIYDYKKRLERTEKSIKSGSYSQRNKELILKFERVLFAEGIKEARVLKYLDQLNRIAIWLNKDFPDVNEDDIYQLMCDIEKSDRSVWTKRDYKVCVKRFFRWVNGGVDPQCTKWISTNVRHVDKKLAEELLTESDVKSMIEAASTARDKAIIAVLYDTGARIREVAEMKIRNIAFDNYGAVITVSGKTGMRRVRIIFSVPYLSAWLDIHPFKNDPNAYIWIGIGRRGNSEQLMYPAFRMLVKRIAARAGINKRVYNHLFRHSRSTELAQHLTEAQMEEHLGWVHGSDMPRTYVHLSGKQIDDALLKMYGIVQKEDTMPQLTSIACPRCGQVNGPTSGFCSKCGMALRVDSAVDVEKKRSDIAMALMELVEKEPEIAKILRESV